MRVRYTPRALADLQALHSYISERSPSGAARIITVIQRRIATLTDQPAIGHRSDEPDVRIILAIPYPYRIYYRVKGEDIEIAHIRHTSRRLLEGGEL